MAHKSFWICKIFRGNKTKFTLHKQKKSASQVIIFIISTLLQAKIKTKDNKAVTVGRNLFRQTMLSFF